MGSSNYSQDAYSYFSRSTVGKSTADVFTQTKTNTIADTMTPKDITFRECRDSDNHPESLAVIIDLDVTGSMGKIPDIIVREKLDKIMSTLIDHGVKDAAVLFCANGDHEWRRGGADRFPFQVGQFESGADELVKCLTSTLLEGGGGGNDVESYCLAHLFAGKYTSIDCYEKRGKKGILFTIGDEGNHTTLSAASQKQIFGCAEAQDLTDKEMLAMAQRLYHVFHIHVNETQYHDDQSVIGYWKNLLGERVIIMEDYNMIAEIIASTVAVLNGVSIDAVTSSFDSITAGSVKTALAKIDLGVSNYTQKTGVVAL